MATQLKKAQGYLKRTIKNSKLNTTSESPNTLVKILFLNNDLAVQTIVFIIYNTKNLIRPGVVINGTTANT